MPSRGGVSMSDCVIARGGGSGMEQGTIALFNNDSPSKHTSEVYSQILKAENGDIIEYSLFSYSFNGNIYNNISRLEASNDGVTWTTVYETKVTNHSAISYSGSVSGYNLYRLYSKCTGDDYAPRSTTAGIASNENLKFTKGNN